MANLIIMVVCFLLGIAFLWLSHDKASFEKTAALEGEEAAGKKFRLIKICGFFMLAGAAVFLIFLFLDL